MSSATILLSTKSAKWTNTTGVQTLSGLSSSSSDDNEEDDDELSINSLLLNPAPEPALVSVAGFFGLVVFFFFFFSL